MKVQVNCKDSEEVTDKITVNMMKIMKKTIKEVIK
jgi:hypothetical protein